MHVCVLRLKCAPGATVRALQYGSDGFGPPHVSLMKEVHDAGWLSSTNRAHHSDMPCAEGLRMRHGVLTSCAGLNCRLSHLQELRLGLQMQAGAVEIGFPLGVLACRLVAAARSTLCQWTPSLPLCCAAAAASLLQPARLPHAVLRCKPSSAQHITGCMGCLSHTDVPSLQAANA